MTRIIAGSAGGRRLRTPPGEATRPTSDRVREALFSALESRLGTLAGRRFLDLYAGSGAVGLEASSRGADAVVLVEHQAQTSALIRANAAAVGLAGITVMTSKAERLAGYAGAEAPVDVAFLDPPYSMTAGEVGQVLVDLAAAGWFASSALIVVERPRRDRDWAWPAGFDPLSEKRYGQTVLWYGHSPVAQW